MASHIHIFRSSMQVNGAHNVNCLDGARFLPVFFENVLQGYVFLSEVRPRYFEFQLFKMYKIE